VLTTKHDALLSRFVGQSLLAQPPFFPRVKLPHFRVWEIGEDLSLVIRSAVSTEGRLATMGVSRRKFLRQRWEPFKDSRGGKAAFVLQDLIFIAFSASCHP
jgi:hypothetical protein